MELVIARGLPGSGKSTLAASLDADVVLSTDDYFTSGEHYFFDMKEIDKAHAWNQWRCKQAMEKGLKRIVIDNTCTRKWEAAPYMDMAKVYGYEVKVVVPDTPWAFDVAECTKRNTHGVPRHAIQRMKDRWEEFNGGEWPLKRKEYNGLRELAERDQLRS